MRKEFGKWLMDIAKYMTMAILLSSTFRQVEKLEDFLVCVIFAGCILIFGLLLVRDVSSVSVKRTKKLHTKK